MWRDKRVFVTGGAGVIGQALVDRLRERGARVWVGDRKPRPDGWDASIRYRRGDLNTLTGEELDAFAPAVVFHLAAVFERTVETWDFWEPTYRDNVQLSNHLASLLKEREDVERVVFASSYLAYDSRRYVLDAPASAPVTLREGDALQPRNVCGAAKLLHETELEFLQSFRPAAPGFDSVCARIFRVYGRGSQDVISRWVRLALAGRPIEVYQPEGRFDYVLADDVAEGLLRLAESEATGVVNLATGRSRQVAEVVSVLRAHLPDLDAVTMPAPAGLGFEASEADVTRLRELTGWSPPRTIEDGIPLLIEHERAARPARAQAAAARAGVLVTSAAAKVPLLRAVRSALDDVGDEGAALHAGDSDPEAVGGHFADAFWAMPRLEDLGPEAIADYCERNGIGLVIPTRDGELPFWAAHREALAAAGVDVLVPAPDAVEACLDKLRFAQALREAGEPAIPTALRPDELEADRFVVKERFGAGAARMALDVDRAGAEAHARSLDAPVFQPYVTGEEYSVDVYTARDGDVRGVVARRREVVRGGESQVTATVRFPALEALAARLAGLLGLRGHAVLQVLVRDDELHVVECNPRFGGASTLALAVGLETFVWALLEARGESLDGRPFTRRAGERRQVRYAADRIVPV